jgi:hypothetical protein
MSEIDSRLRYLQPFRQTAQPLDITRKRSLTHGLTGEAIRRAPGLAQHVLDTGVVPQPLTLRLSRTSDEERRAFFETPYRPQWTPSTSARQSD